MQIEGTVVHMANHREADRLVEVMSPQAGRLRLRAPAARRSRRRFGGGLDVFSRLGLDLFRDGAHPAGALPVLSSVTLVDARVGLRASLEAVAAASLCCRALRALVPVGAPDDHSRQIALALDAALDRAAAGHWPASLAFLPTLARAAGLMPAMRCSVCQAAAGVLGAVPGGFAHRHCRPTAAPVAPEILTLLAGHGVPEGAGDASALFAAMRRLLQGSAPEALAPVAALEELLWPAGGDGVQMAGPGAHDDPAREEPVAASRR